MRLGAGALARRSWVEAARHFERAAELKPEPGFVDYLEIYALARAGAREDARERLRLVSGDSDLGRWLERTFELQ